MTMSLLILISGPAEALLQIYVQVQKYVAYRTISILHLYQGAR